MLEILPQPPAPPTSEQIAREVLAWLLEGKEIGLHAVAVKLALSRQDDEFCRRWAEQTQAYLRETGQEEAGDTANAPEPLAMPTWEQMALAIDAWAVVGDTRELKNGDPVCMALLGIADRLVKSRETPQNAKCGDSRRSTPSGVVFPHPPPQTPLVDRRHYDEVRAQLIAVTARLAGARIALQHLNDWATMDPEGERFPWIANETAAALDGLK